MKVRAAQPVAGGRLASSAQPPRATSSLTHWLASQHTPQPFPSVFVLDTPGALLKGLRCFTAFRPLPLGMLCLASWSRKL
jgi:hypothetical protein